ncbi:MAG: POTRA domain-containing protein, partial [Gammaproteobacteria bacterium]
MNRYLYLSLIYIFIFFPLSVHSEEIKIKVNVTGLNKELKENIELNLSIEQLKKDKKITVQKIKSAHRRAKKEIIQALQPFGYYLPKISSKLVEQNNIFHASYQIDKGPATLITQINVKVEGEGELEPELKSVVHGHELKVGERLIHSAYKTLKRNLYNVAFSEGYLD